MYDPAKRISAKRAMNHPYFDDLDKTTLPAKPGEYQIKFWTTSNYCGTVDIASAISPILWFILKSARMANIGDMRDLSKAPPMASYCTCLEIWLRLYTAKKTLSQEFTMLKNQLVSTLVIDE